jgi:hypothetical protein
MSTGENSIVDKDMFIWLILSSNFILVDNEALMQTTFQTAQRHSHDISSKRHYAMQGNSASELSLAFVPLSQQIYF